MSLEINQLKKKKILVIGANYGLLLAGALIERNFTVDVFGKSEEVDTLIKEGFSIKWGDKNFKFESSKNLKFIKNLIDDDYILAILAVQEPSLANPAIKDIISLISKKSIPILSVMNIPLLNFLKDIVGIKNIKKPELIYSGLNTSSLINSKLIINCSPEPQIFSISKFNELSIRLGGVFRCSSLGSIDEETISDLTKTISNGLPVKIKNYKSAWVSLSKLPMLIVGNYRCLDNFKLRSIQDAVNQNIQLSEKIYNQVIYLIKYLGAGRESIIPFKLYLKATNKLDAPSSVARSIVNGKINVERVDKLVQILCNSISFYSPEIEQIVLNIENSMKFFSKKN